MKRLLLLGGTTISCEIVEQAHKMGIEVHVSDYNTHSPAKQIADKSYMVSATDVAAITALIKENNIDGVITGYADVLLPYYVEICHQAGIPCYATAQQIEVTTDKAKFKQACQEHHIAVVPEYSYQEVVDGKVAFPLLVKPIDNSGARGIYICNTPTEFQNNYAKALSFSRSGNILIEQYVKGSEATLFYYFHQGEVYLLGMGDRHMLRYDGEHLPLPIGYTFPSHVLDTYLKEHHANMVSLFKSLGMQEGLAFVQTFASNESVMVYEMGYRLTGTLEHHLFEQVYHFNPMAALIDFAVGNTIDPSSLKRLDTKQCCMANLTLLMKPGYIASCQGINEVRRMDGVLHVAQSHKQGETLPSQALGTLQQVAIRVLLTANNKAQLIARMDAIKDTLDVMDSDGNSLLMKEYTYSDIIQSS